MRPSKSEFLVIIGFLSLAFAFFWPVTFGGRTLLPADVLYQYSPWRAYASQLGAAVPQNHLVADLILENYQWKRFILDALGRRELPLWNPYIFAGMPFLADGQHSALYPFSIIFYLLPLAQAYGIFTALQLFIAALGMYVFLRVLGTGRFPAVLGGITYGFSGFMLVSVPFTMVIAAVCWLPWILAVTELGIRAASIAALRPAATAGTPERSRPSIRPWDSLPYLLLGSILLGVQFLAGHVEISYYILMVLAFYSAWRLIALWRQTKALRPAVHLGMWLLGMVALGVALGAVQLVPLYELVRVNFRQGSASYQEVVGWALPLRRAISFLIPDFFGNPSHHSYFDLLSLSTKEVTQNFKGQPLTHIPENIFGIKNYVESGSYVGLLPLLLAGIAIIKTLAPLMRGRRREIAAINNEVSTAAAHSFAASTLPFLILAVLSLLFAFGTPLYALLYYGLPGYNQLHSPFRWIFPYTLSISVLAGLGAQALAARSHGRLVPGDAREGETTSALPWVASFGWSAFWLGLAGLGALGISLLFRQRMAELAQAIMLRSASLQEVFADGAMFYSYEARNLAIFFAFLLLAGIVIRVSLCPIYFSIPIRKGNAAAGPEGAPPAPKGRDLSPLSASIPVWQPLAILVLVLDLYVAFGAFNPAVEPRLLEFVPKGIRFLLEDKDLFRVMGYGPDKPLHTNAAMSYGIHDARGYDSIIPKQYADYMNLIEGQGSLLYNRIGDVTWHGNLDSQLLDLLNVKYVVTNQEIANPGYTLVYADDIRIYRNDDFLPRAFVIYQAKVVTRDELAKELKGLNPREMVLLEADDAALRLYGARMEGSVLREERPSPPGSRFAPAEVSQYAPNRVVISATLDAPGYLVLADSYFPGWTAADNGHEVPILRANGNFRAVFLTEGQHTVIFKYSPLSFLLGLFSSLSAAVVVLLGLGAWAWQRYYRESSEEHPARRVAKNALTPMTTNLVNKGIDFAFAMLMLRLLGPEGAGRFAYAVNLALFFGVITDFGLGVLATREVAKDRSQANRYLTNTALVRVGLSLVALLPMLAVVNLNVRLTPDTVAVIVLLWFSLVPGGIASSLSYLFNAFERFEFPAAVTVIIKVSSTFLAVTTLLLGGGIVGLAAVSVVANLASAGILFYLVKSQLFQPSWQPDLSLIKAMLREAYPLMVNNLLATIFFRIDVQILQPLKGDEVVGYYNAAYKYIDGLNIIPSNFTLALFPVLARYGVSAKESMIRAYHGALRLLVMVALPIAVGMSLAARELILILGGGAFLPHAMIALQVLVWFLPFSFINSVTQYVLIALNQQRFLTLAFLIGVVFNISANLAFIPAYSYVAAAATTIASEIALLMPFYYAVRRHLAPIPWIALFWRPTLAALVMWVAGQLLSQAMNPLAAVSLGGLIYLGVLVALRTFSQDDIVLARRVLGRLG